MRRPALFIHGGAGRMEIPETSAIEAGCRAAVRAGWRVLDNDGDALAAVVAAVIELENDPQFNAGLGSVLTAAGTVETDASVMDGTTLAAGACGAVGGVRNPIELALAILRRSTAVLLVGAGAEVFAGDHGVTRCGPEDLITDRQRQRWQQSATAIAGGGTVGAVAVDRFGHVAAATSTGGLLRKPPGRVGDSAIIGAGTYADDRAGAASATGAGEAIMRTTLARTAVELLRDGRDPMTAARLAIAELAARTHATAGVILVDCFGRLGCAYNTPQLPRAHGDLRSRGITFAC